MEERVTFKHFGRYSHTLEFAGNMLITAKRMYKKYVETGVDISVEIISIENQAIEVLCGVNSAFNEFLLAYYNDRIDIDDLLDAVTYDEDVVDSLAVSDYE